MRCVNWWRAQAYALMLASTLIVVGAAIAATSALAAVYVDSATSPVWIRDVLRYNLAPMPPGDLTIEVGPVSVAGRAAGGSWDGSILRVPDGQGIALAHELGHAFDSRAMTDDDRARFTPMLGLPDGTPWRNSARWAPGGDMFCYRIACPDERLADAYAGCALGLTLVGPHDGPILRWRELGSPWWSGSASWRTTRARLARVCRELRRVGRGRGVESVARVSRAGYVVLRRALGSRRGA